MIKMMVAQVFTDFFKASNNLGKVSLLMQRVIKMAPTAPTLAASEQVAKPP